MGLFVENINESNSVTQPENVGGAGTPLPVGISDPNPTLLPGGSGDSTTPIDPVPTTNPVPNPLEPGPSLDELYPVDPGIQNVDQGVLTPTVETDKSVAEVGTPGSADANTGILAEGEGINAEQSILTPDQLVDQDLARIMGQGSPLMERARQESLQQSNRRGLQNSSIAVGAAQGAMVDRMLPMAQQNAAQGFERAQQNTAFRQDASKFSADQLNRLRGLEAELGTDVSMFNADQLNRAEELSAQMRTAMEQQDTAAYNQAATMFTQLQFEASAENAAAQNAINSQMMSQITQLNNQFLQGSQAMDLATIQGTYQQLIATNEAASNLYQAYFAGISTVMADRKMSPQQIAQAVETQQEMLEAGLRMIAEINGMDFGPEGG